MAVQVNPIAPSLPATTAIQDPATRRFAQAVEDALRALRSEEGAVESLKKAADAMNNAVAGGTPPSIAQWLFSSELYQKLTTEIARVDTQAKQDVLDEALARSQAIQEIQAALAEIESTPAYGPATTYQIGDLVTYDNKLYRAKAETTGNLPTNTTYWDKVGDYASLGDVVAAHALQLSEIESDITDIGGDLAAEITARDTLAAQLRGTYAGTDVAMVSQGLLYSERQARVTADGVTVSNLNALRAQVGVTEAGTLTEGLILNEQTIRNTNDLAIVQALDTLWSISGASKALSQDGKNLITNWQTATAQEWQTLQAEVLDAGGNTLYAAVAAESQARADFEGKVAASWMIKAEVDVGTGKPYVAGIALGAEGQDGAATSEFLVRADRFAMVMPGYGEHVPFAIGPSGAEFTGLTSWSNVTGASKPQDGATRNVFQGDWTTSTSYAVGDIVLKDGNGWSCILAHTSSSSNQPPASGSGNTWWTLYAVKGSDGAQGLHALTVLVPNSAHTLPAASDGVVASYTGSGTAIQVFEGTTALSAVSSITANGQFTIGTPTQVPASTITVGARSYADTTVTVAQHSAMLAGTDLVVVTYPITVRRTDGTTVTLSATQTLTKSKAGAQGVDGAPGPAGPAVVVTANRALSFTATDGTLDGSQTDIVLTAAVSGIASPAYAWTFSGLQTNPTASTTNSQTITAAQFGTSKAATVTCTVNGTYKDQVTIVRLEKSTAEAGATVGADSSNLRAGPGVNMVFNGDYTDGLAGTVVGWRSGGNQHVLGRNNPSYFVQGEGTAYIMQPGTPGAGVLFDADILNGQSGQYFAVTPGKKYEISAWLNCHRCEGRIGVVFYDAAGTQLSIPTGSAVTHASSITSIADMRQSWAIVTAPATAVKAYLIVRGYNTGLNDPYVFFSRVYFGEAGAGQTEPSLWTPGRGISQITPSNVSTYIANAALGNAQIGGNLWSTNWNYAGGTGWLLDRSGNFYGNNVYARGNIEASSLKADAANIVNTLNVAGNAITTPLAGTIAALTVNQTVLNTYTYSRTLGTITTSAQGRGQVLILVTPYKDEPLAQAFTSSDYYNASVATRITRNSIAIFETTATGPSANTNLRGAVYLDTPGAGVECTYAVETYTYRGTGGAQASQSHRIAQASFFIMEFKK